jgi:cellobiose phosphorylase
LQKVTPASKALRRKKVDGLRINLCPSHWPGFKAVRRFRGKRLEIEFLNPRGVCRGVASLIFYGQPVTGNLIPVEQLREKNQVIVTLGD